ncbi:pyridoxamine 5'-phosphate oxidase [Occallatibacter savannae]|uniref:pyridoxamine 5'-phosphate oxidase n=1 Tax=Occallatibacter savannae TaxID=1002691 RepID=UPI000D690DDC|nr:pyridoxamine 5'-phosphate oxidase [Occallatibacter savannae]
MPVQIRFDGRHAAINSHRKGKLILPEDNNHEIGVRDPLELFDEWLTEANRSELNDPNAAALATASSDAVPSVRMVLVKRVRMDRFCFFTNIESQKGRELLANPQCALGFHWKSLRRQVRVEGKVYELPSPVVDEYFHSRSRRSQIGAAVSNQSRVLPSRAELEQRVRSFAAANHAEVPRPSYWRGFRVDPVRIEFWISGEDRLHDRFLFTLTASVWQQVRLYP